MIDEVVSITNPYSDKEDGESHRKAEVLFDTEFPRIEDVHLPVGKIEDLAYIVSYVEPIHIMKHTPSMGRAGFYAISYEAGGNNYNCIFVKGTGKPKVYTDFSDVVAPFTIPDENDPNELNRKRAGYGRDVIGLSTREDQRLDAEKSIQMANLGVKVRLPMAGFYLNAIETAKGLENVDTLVASGVLKDSERPYMSYWTMETPYRVGDFYQVVSNKNESDIRDFLINAARYARNTQNPQTRELYETMRHLVETGAPTEQLLEKWIDFLLNKLTGGFRSMAEHKLVHHNLHAQNITIHAEFCDNSEVTLVDNEAEARRLLNDDVKVFFDGFYNIWRNYVAKTHCPPEYQERFERKAQQLLEEFA